MSLPLSPVFLVNDTTLVSRTSDNKRDTQTNSNDLIVIIKRKRVFFFFTHMLPQFRTFLYRTNVIALLVSQMDARVVTACVATLQRAIE